LKKVLNILMFIFLITIFSSTKVFAATSNSIVIDGNFNEWNGKTSYNDAKHDIKSNWLDFEEVKYFADDKYLYLYVTRGAAEKSSLWSFDVVIFNGVKGTKYTQYPFGQKQPVYAPKFDVVVDYTDKKNHNGTTVNVSFDGDALETTFSAANNAKEIEFRVPLDRVGLDGLNKEVKFALKSEKDGKTGEIDWVADEGPIVITTGPTLWQVSSLILFGFVTFSAYTIYKRKNKESRAIYK